MLYQFLNEKMSFHEKKKKKKARKSSAPKGNVELIQGSEEQSNNSDLIRHSVYRAIKRKIDHIS